METKFSASLDTTAKLISVFCLVVFALLLGFLLVNFDSNKSFLPIIMPVIVLPIATILCYGYRPTGYEITESEVIVNRPFKTVSIPITSIKSARLVEKGISRRTIRTFGVGGLFGYFGNFRNREFGAMTWYLTRRENVVLIETTRTKIALSPNDYEKFLELLTSRINSRPIDR